MATKITIGNKTTAIPGVYSQIKSGIVNPASDVDFGNVVIIDDGSFGSDNYIATNGIVGENKQGLDSVQVFSEYLETQSTIWDSELVPVLKSLFNPSKRRASLGINKLYYIQAAETTKAIAAFAFSKGLLGLKTQFEGKSLNGALATKTYTQSSSTPELPAPSGLIIQSFDQYGSLPANTYFYKITALNQYGETIGSTEVSKTITTNFGYVYLYWAPIAGASSYRIYRGVATDAQNKYFVTNANYFTDSGEFAGTTGTIPVTNTTGNAAGALIPTSSELSRGVAMKLETGRSFGYSLSFYRGQHDKMSDPLNPGYSFQGKSIDSIYQGVSAGTLNIQKPVLLFRSPDVRRLSELKRWMDRSPDFKKWFGITNFQFDELDDVIVTTDITDNQSALAPYVQFQGGTTEFTDDAFTQAVQLSKNLDNTFYLALKGGDEATGVNNTAIFNLLESRTLKYEKYALVPGYTDSSNLLGELDSTQFVSNYYNSASMIVTHGLSKVTNADYPGAFRNISVLEKTAKVLGRICGLPPQTPITFKDIDIDSEVHKLSEADQEAAIEAGILCTHYDIELGAVVILAGVNTLGNNDFLVNDDATSYDVAVERIKSQLNKEIVYAAKRAFFNSDQGPNRNTISAADLLTWTTGFLASKEATDQKDNLIIRFGEITVRVDQDNYFVDYEFVPNFPVNKIIFTGIILGA